MTNVFQFNDYRKVLHEAVTTKKAQFGRAFTFDKMAKACRLQRTYLSAVLGGRGHLNADQVFMACDFLEMSEDEYRFTSALHERERSVFPSRKLRLEREIAGLRASALKTEKHLKSTAVHNVETPAMLEFYLDINAQLTHMFLTIERFRRDPDSIRKTLGLDGDVFRQILTKIERAELIRRSGAKIEVLRDSFHLPASSPLFSNYRTQMRLKAMDLMESRSKDQHYSFSVVYSADEGSRRKILAKFLEFVDWAQKETQGEKEAHVYQMNFDLLRWSPE